LSLLDPLLDILSQELARANGLHDDGHEAVVGTTPVLHESGTVVKAHHPWNAYFSDVCSSRDHNSQLRALAVEHALAVDSAPNLVQAPWNGIDLDAQRGHSPAV